MQCYLPFWQLYLDFRAFNSLTEFATSVMMGSMADSNPVTGLLAQQTFCSNVLDRENKSQCNNANASSLQSLWTATETVTVIALDI